ncbi:hypothetical protein AMATHDRAFT_62370 [Amanita thiersii Skay4041]|uniref:DUF6533 domain-containing protein n=1 Tax=Amanita thiersii Skay4041 TaxID=703135 RepID=A0A2A9NFQ9_9AGAR|nr:hypothetical protein AMATHDRAFT_62370 [Amanita thiersii Skay4041]
MPEVFNELERKAFLRFCATLVSTGILVLESALMFKKEYRFVWRAPVNIVKCIYVLSRYPILFFQIADSVVVSTRLRVVPVSRGLCILWFSVQTCATVLSLALLEAILMIRVYALHEKSRRIGKILACSLFVEQFCSISMAILTLRQLSVDDACVATNTPKGAVAFGGVSIAQQLLIWGLTFKRRSFLRTLNDAGRRITQVMMRDGTLVLIGVSMAIATMIPYSLYVDQVTHVLFSIIIPLFSVSTCRLVINMQDLNTEISSVGSQELTSIEVSSVQPPPND